MFFRGFRKGAKEVPIDAGPFRENAKPVERTIDKLRKLSKESKGVTNIIYAQSLVDDFIERATKTAKDGWQQEASLHVGNESIRELVKQIKHGFRVKPDRYCTNCIMVDWLELL